MHVPGLSIHRFLDFAITILRILKWCRINNRYFEKHMKHEFYLELIWFDVKFNLKRRMNSIFAVRLSIKMQNGQAIADKMC